MGGREKRKRKNPVKKRQPWLAGIKPVEAFVDTNKLHAPRAGNIVNPISVALPIIPPPAHPSTPRPVEIEVAASSLPADGPASSVREREEEEEEEKALVVGWHPMLGIGENFSLYRCWRRLFDESCAAIRHRCFFVLRQFAQAVTCRMSWSSIWIAQEEPNKTQHLAAVMSPSFFSQSCVRKRTWLRADQSSRIEPYSYRYCF